MKALRSRGVRIVAGLGVLAAPMGTTFVGLSAGSAQAAGEVSASSAGTYVGSHAVTENADVYGNLRLQVTLDGSNHITAVTVLESPGTAAALAQLAAGNSALAGANRDLTQAESRSASATAQVASANAAVKKAKAALKKAKGKKKKAAKKRVAVASASLAAANAALAAANAAAGAARSAVGSANSTIAAANAEITLHETSQSMSDYALPTLKEDALYSFAGRSDHPITSSNVLTTTDIATTAGASATEAAFRQSLQAALVSAGA